MTDVGSAESGFLRWLVGKPRIWVGVLWCGIGLAWLLTAAFDEPTTSRVLLGAVWLALGTTEVVIALLDRKNGRGFYRNPAPARVSGPFTEAEQNVNPDEPPPRP